jgi:hypothetical protein
MSGSQSCTVASLQKNTTTSVRLARQDDDDDDEVQEWQRLAHLHQHIYSTKSISHIKMYQPILPTTHALPSKNGVRRCCGKNKVVASSLSLNPVHFSHPEGKLRRGGAMQ